MILIFFYWQVGVFVCVCACVCVCSKLIIKNIWKPIYKYESYTYIDLQQITIHISKKEWNYYKEILNIVNRSIERNEK